MNEEKIKKFYMDYIHQSHLPLPMDAVRNEEKPEVQLMYPLDKGSYYRIYSNRWAYEFYPS